MGVVTKRSLMTYFSDPSEHYSHRVRIVLAEKGVSVDVISTDKNELPDEVSEVSPYQSLPVLLDRDLALYESKVIMEYLDERFPHPPLLPVYPVARAKSRLWMYRIERDWSPLVDSLTSDSPKNAATKTKQLKESLLAIAPIFTEMPFFMSDEFTIVDCCLAPILWRLPQLGISFASNRQTKPLLDYMERLFARESFIASLTDVERDIRPQVFEAM